MAPTTRRMWINPGYDCVNLQPCKFDNEQCTATKGRHHGRHAAEMFMAVLGHEAEVIFSVNTMWTPHPVRAHSEVAPYGQEVVWHTAWPQEGQTEKERREPNDKASCKDWKDCYQQSTGITYTNELMALLVTEGSDAVFKWLENEYWKLVK